MSDGTRDPEWFIGEPWHGRDKQADFPDRDFGGVIIAQVIEPASWSEIEDETYLPEPRAVMYRRQKFAIGRYVLIVWVSSDLDSTEAGTRLAELLLAPHKVREQSRAQR